MTATPQAQQASPVLPPVATPADARTLPDGMLYSMKPLLADIHR
jgi:hypothetical protein